MKVNISEVNKPFSAYPKGTTFVLDETVDAVEGDFLDALGVTEEELLKEVQKEAEKYEEETE